MLTLFVELEIDVERKYDRDFHLFAEGSGDGLVGGLVFRDQVDHTRFFVLFRGSRYVGSGVGYLHGPVYSEQGCVGDYNKEIPLECIHFHVQFAGRYAYFVQFLAF